MEGGSDEDELWTVGRTCLWPNCLFTGDHFEWRVPIDDENTLSVGWFFNAVPEEQRPFKQERIPYWYSPIKDQETGRWITSHVMNQDFVAWVGQDIVADRTQEHLGDSDRGIIAMRRRLMEDVKVVADGGEPKALVRDPELNRCVTLPIIGRDSSSMAPPVACGSARARASYGDGLPVPLRPTAGGDRAYREAMGLCRSIRAAVSASPVQQ